MWPVAPMTTVLVIDPPQKTGAAPGRGRPGAARTAVLGRSGLRLPAREGRGARVAAGAVELVLDAEELVVLVDPLAAGRGTGLDLTGVDGDRQVGDRRVQPAPPHRGR